MWATKKRQLVSSLAENSRYGRVFLIGCDMCLKVEFVIVPLRHILYFLLEEAGWFANGGAVICPKCSSEMKGA